MKKILLILTQTLGDCLLINNIINQIKKKYPESKVDVFINNKWKELIVYNPNINLVYSHENCLSIWSEILKKSFEYDEVMIAQQTSREDNIWHHMPRYKNQHLLNFYLQRCDLDKVDINKEEIIFYPKRVEELDLPKKYCVIHTTSGVKSKDWNIDNFKEICKYLLTQDIIPIQVGTEKDVVIDNIFGVLDYREKLDFSEIYNLCKKAEFFIGLDSGLSYLAAASGCNVLQILGATIPTTSGAFGKKVITALSETHVLCQEQRCHGNCKFKNPCINNISFQKIIEVINEHFIHHKTICD